MKIKLTQQDVRAMLTAFHNLEPFGFTYEYRITRVIVDQLSRRLLKKLIDGRKQYRIELEEHEVLAARMAMTMSSYDNEYQAVIGNALLARLDQSVNQNT